MVFLLWKMILFSRIDAQISIAPEFDSGIKFDDPDINIEWPFNLIDTEILTSEKDSKLQSLKEFIAKNEPIE